MKITYVWKVLSEDGLLKDPPKFTDEFCYEFKVNYSDDYNKPLTSREEAYKNLQRVREETKDPRMEYTDFVLVEIVRIY